jgi:hypothetical protein
VSTATTSVLQSAKGALLDLLTDRAGLAEVQLAYADPGRFRRTECIFFGSTRGEHKIASIKAGRQSRNERLEVELYLYAYHKGSQDPKTSEARVLELLGEVEDALAESPQLGLTGAVSWAKLGAIEEIDCGMRDEGTDAVALVRIEIEARLS